MIYRCVIEHTTGGVRVGADEYDLSNGVQIECPEEATFEDVLRAYGAFIGWHANRLDAWTEQGLVNGFQGYDAIRLWVIGGWK